MKIVNSLFSLFLIVTFLSCGISKKSESTQRLESLEKHKLIKNENNYFEKPFVVTIKNEVVEATEIAIENNRTSFSTKRAFYGEYGKWDDVLFDIGKRHPILKWERIKLFNSQNDFYTVFADGVEDYELMYGSFVILNQDGEDILMQDSPIREQAIERVKQLERLHSGNKNFYEEYWNQVDPDTWKRIKNN